ncbi:MAG TPA: class I SAM-dependent methyltransferase [Chloroflexia bacterium]|jgi:ubiquinone/menaquinone biosynthesis C-methylase UbiE
MALVNRVQASYEQILEPRDGYDLTAPFYEQRYWSEFWRLNEGPVVLQWLKSLKPGFGLDAGSGTGTYIQDIVELDHRVVALDLSWKMLMINREKTTYDRPDELVGYVQGKIDALPFKSNRFDWVLCSRVLNHIPQTNLAGLLREFARVLKRKGECLISDIHPHHPYRSVAIPVNGKKIAIETYKHTLVSFRRAVATVEDFELVTLDEYYLNDLEWKPPRTSFGKLYRGSNAAIFYVARLKKL